jgi:HPt (histidine-containing phosphotransfer) domain-containing protein
LIFDKYLSTNESLESKISKMTEEEMTYHFDRIKAEKYIGKDVEVMKQFVSLIHLEIAKSISNLEEAINQKDLKALKAIGHRLKGATLTAGMQILSKFAMQFSELTSFNQENVEQLLKGLKKEAELVMEILNQKNP